MPKGCLAATIFECLSAPRIVQRALASSPMKFDPVLDGPYQGTAAWVTWSLTRESPPRDQSV